MEDLHSAPQGILKRPNGALKVTSAVFPTQTTPKKYLSLIVADYCNREYFLTAEFNGTQIWGAEARARGS